VRHLQPLLNVYSPTATCAIHPDIPALTLRGCEITKSVQSHYNTSADPSSIKPQAINHPQTKPPPVIKLDVRFL